MCNIVIYMETNAAINYLKGLRRGGEVHCKVIAQCRSEDQAKLVWCEAQRSLAYINSANAWQRGDWDVLIFKKT